MSVAMPIVVSKLGGDGREHNGVKWYDVVVTCPFCGEEHHHGLVPGSSFRMRAADCGGGQYELGRV